MSLLCITLDVTDFVLPQKLMIESTEVTIVSLLSAQNSKWANMGKSFTWRLRKIRNGTRYLSAFFVRLLSWIPFPFYTEPYTCSFSLSFSPSSQSNLKIRVKACKMLLVCWQVETYQSDFRWDVYLSFNVGFGCLLQSIWLAEPNVMIFPKTVSLGDCLQEKRGDAHHAVQKAMK